MEDELDDFRAQFIEGVTDCIIDNCKSTIDTFGGVSEGVNGYILHKEGWTFLKEMVEHAFYHLDTEEIILNCMLKNEETNDEQD